MTPWFLPTVGHPPVFLTNTFLKYIAWQLYDQQSARVRLYALRAMLAMYATFEASGSSGGGSGADVKRLDDFIRKYGGRIAAMSR